MVTEGNQTHCGDHFVIFKKRSERQRRKGKINQFDSQREQQGEIRKPSSGINATKQTKQQNGEDQISLQENQRYQENISCKDRHNKGQTQYGPNRSRRY